MKIDVQDALIKTASVEVKTLTISGKQVTLAVFRQLMQENILTPELDFRGIPWGVVNYHQPGCPNDAHLHIVWQSGSELRHAVETIIDHRNISILHEAVDVWKEIMACLALIADSGYQLLEPDNGSDRRRIWLPHFPEIDYLLIPDRYYAGNYRKYYAETDDAYRARLRVEAHRQLVHLEQRIKYLQRIGSGRRITFEEALDKHDRAEREMRDYKEKYESRINELRALPQLFIAV